MFMVVVAFANEIIGATIMMKTKELCECENNKAYI
jgi:hypothetical protein